MNSSPQHYLADCGLSFLPLTHVPTTPYSRLSHCDVIINILRHYMRDHYLEKIDSRQIATPIISQMRNILGIIPM